MKKLGIGVIGLGVGERHIVGYHDIPEVEVRACCDIDAVKLSEVAARQNIGRREQDWRKIIEADDIDAVSICSYDDAHCEQVVAALEAGKHVMVEKPVTLNRRDLEKVVRAQQDSGRILTSNLILRKSPRFREIHDMARRGEFGDIFYVEGDYIHQILWKITEGWRGKMDFYCVTYGGGIHLIDLMRWIVGEEVATVAGLGAKKLTRGTEFRFPDTIASLLRFESDALAKTTTTFGPKRRQIHTLNIYGTELSFENANGDAKIFYGDGPDDWKPMTTPYPAIEKGDLLPDFIAAIRENREPDVTVRDVVRVMDICFSCWESVEKGRTVPVTYTL